MSFCNCLTSTSEESRPDDGPRILERSETRVSNALRDVDLVAGLRLEPEPRASLAIDGAMIEVSADNDSFQINVFKVEKSEVEKNLIYLCS